MRLLPLALLGSQPMSRFNPHRTIKGVYGAAAQWRANCLETDGSVLADERSLWTPTLLDELDRRFVKNLDEGKGDFWEKLQAQLLPGSPACKQLMAEQLWILMLFQSNITEAYKRDRIHQVWSWSGEELPDELPHLSDAVLHGIGSPGTAYNTARWRELVCLIASIRDFKRRGPNERAEIVADPWAFAGWLDGIPEARNRQLRHILAHLLYPDTFERISTERDKKQILATLREIPEKEVRKWDLIAMDRALFDLRKRLENEQGADVDFYQEEFRNVWSARPTSWLLNWSPSKWAWASMPTDRKVTLAGEKVSNSWPCGSAKLREGDRVYLMRTGVEPNGVVATGTVTRAPYEMPDWHSNREDMNGFERFIDVEFDAVRDADHDSIVLLEELERIAPKQDWAPQSRAIELRRQAARTLERRWKALPQISLPVEPSGMEGREQAATRPVDPINLILYGPPGTGKTYRLMTEYLPRYRDDGEDRFEFVTFHQSYAYEDFVEGIRPETEEGNIKYRVRPGALRRICNRARKAPNKRFGLFIDEINRGNVPKIFGELISLVEVDKRIRTDASGDRVPACSGLEVTLPYSGEPFGVPRNVDVIGTMNTADRSIALLDSALRRRFRFEELTPQPRLLKTIDDGAEGVIDLQQLLETINNRLTHLLHRDQTIGHSYLHKVATFDELRRVFAREILPLLQEACYDDWNQIRLVLADQTVGEEFQLVRARAQTSTQLFPNMEISDIPDKPAYEVIREDEITPDAIRKVYETPE